MPEFALRSVCRWDDPAARRCDGRLRFDGNSGQDARIPSETEERTWNERYGQATLLAPIRKRSRMRKTTVSQCRPGNPAAKHILVGIACERPRWRHAVGGPVGHRTHFSRHASGRTGQLSLCRPGNTGRRVRGADGLAAAGRREDCVSEIDRAPSGQRPPLTTTRRGGAVLRGPVTFAGCGLGT